MRAEVVRRDAPDDDDDGRGIWRKPCTGCGLRNPGHPGSRCPGRLEIVSDPPQYLGPLPGDAGQGAEERVDDGLHASVARNHAQRPQAAHGAEHLERTKKLRVARAEGGGILEEDGVGERDDDHDEVQDVPRVLEIGRGVR